MPYRCAKFERNRTMGKLFLCGSKNFHKQCEEEEEGEEKCEENWAILDVYILFTTNLISFKFDM